MRQVSRVTFLSNLLQSSKQTVGTDATEALLLRVNIKSPFLYSSSLLDQ